MPRYVALLHGVNPQNAPSTVLRQVFEGAGLAQVRTVRSSGNVAFDAPATAAAALERTIESALQAALGRGFHPIVRHAAELVTLIERDPWRAYTVPQGAKRVVSFLREPRAPRVPLPLTAHQAQVFALEGREAFTAYTVTAAGPVFMQLIEQAFGAEVTTRTWDTVCKCAQA